MRSKLAFITGFGGGLVLFGILNYLTFVSPFGCGRNEFGVLSLHCTELSGFPFTMVESDMGSRVVWTGLALDFILAIGVSVIFGWFAIRIAMVTAKLK